MAGGARRTGSANLPLHGGKVPPWLFQRMVRLSRAVLWHMASEYEPEEVLRRLRARRTSSRCSAYRDWGPRQVRALALVAELVYGTPASTRDPARFAFAHGGKDGTPFAVDRETYDRTIETMNAALAAPEVDRRERVAAVRRLTKLAPAA